MYPEMTCYSGENLWTYFCENVPEVYFPHDVCSGNSSCALLCCTLPSNRLSATLWPNVVGESGSSATTSIVQGALGPWSWLVVLEKGSGLPVWPLP